MAKQSYSDRLKRLQEGRCPVHGVALDMDYTPGCGYGSWGRRAVLRCPRRDCGAMANVAFSGHWEPCDMEILHVELLPRFQYLLDEAEGAPAPGASPLPYRHPVSDLDRAIRARGQVESNSLDARAEAAQVKGWLEELRETRAIQDQFGAAQEVEIARLKEQVKVWRLRAEGEEKAAEMYSRLVHPLVMQSRIRAQEGE
jgi:hypothetical protein